MKGHIKIRPIKCKTLGQENSNPTEINRFNFLKILMKLEGVAFFFKNPKSKPNGSNINQDPANTSSYLGNMRWK